MNSGNDKTKKSVAKRIRITRRGKVVRRPMAVNHSRTRQNAKRIRQKRQTRGLDRSNRYAFTS